jgi:two-component system sensor histidine kinase BaeS
MGEHRHTQWGQWRGGGSRPPWWPEDEPFPPRGGPPWRGMRRHFLRRVAVTLLFFFVLVFLASALAVTLVSGAFGVREHKGFVPPVAFLGVVLLVVGFVAAGRALRRVAGPVGDVMEAADRVAGGDYAVRVAERGPGEMRRLARSFNAMTERLGANEEQRRNLLADVAHELRTPLSVIQGNTEGMLDGVYAADRAHLEPVLEEAKVMSRLLKDLETLSTAEAGALRLHREPVEPARLVEDAVAAFRSRADEAGVRLDGRSAPGLPSLDVDPVRVGQVLSNLLSNAVRHTPRGGSVVVSAEPADVGAAVAFAVEDTGPGIPEVDLPHVFDRFVKAADSGGAGLGLAIAKSLVEAHGGRITAAPRPGGGTRMTFELPAGR